MIEDEFHNADGSYKRYQPGEEQDHDEHVMDWLDQLTELEFDKYAYISMSEQDHGL